MRRQRGLSAVSTVIAVAALVTAITASYPAHADETPAPTTIATSAPVAPEPAPTPTGPVLDTLTQPVPNPNTATATPTKPTPTSSGATPSAKPSPTPTTPAPNGDGEQPIIPTYTDDYLNKWEAFQIAQMNAVNAQNRIANARTALGTAGQALQDAQRDLRIAQLVEQAAQKAFDATVRGMYQEGTGNLGGIITIITNTPDEALRALETTAMIDTAANANLNDYEAATLARQTAETNLATAQTAYNDALTELTDAETVAADADKALADAQKKYGDAITLSGPQTQIGTDGCPISSPDNTLRDGADIIGLRRICKQAVTQAATPQAAAAIKWGLSRLGAPYACKGIGRMDPFRFDCSSLVSRAYWEGAGVPIAGDTWAPSTRNMTPWDGVSLDQHLAYVDPIDIRPGDLVLYNTCPQGGCAYRHVVMYLGSPDGGKTYWMLHTNSCGDVAKIESFWGFSADRNFEVVRRVMTLDGEKVTPAILVNPETLTTPTASPTASAATPAPRISPKLRTP